VERARGLVRLASSAPGSPLPALPACDACSGLDKSARAVSLARGDAQALCSVSRFSFSRSGCPLKIVANRPTFRLSTATVSTIIANAHDHHHRFRSSSLTHATRSAEPISRTGSPQTFPPLLGCLAWSPSAAQPCTSHRRLSTVSRCPPPTVSSAPSSQRTGSPDCLTYP
jgi:hypothetical protein